MSLFVVRPTPAVTRPNESGDGSLTHSLLTEAHKRKLLTGSLLLLKPPLALADQNTAMVGVEDIDCLPGLGLR
jgi:hypothetical protein